VQWRSAYGGDSWNQLLSRAVRVTPLGSKEVHRYELRAIVPNLRELVLEKILPAWFREEDGRPLIRFDTDNEPYMDLSEFARITGLNFCSSLRLNPITPLPWALSLARSAILSYLGLIKDCWFRIKDEEFNLWGKYYDRRLVEAPAIDTLEPGFLFANKTWQTSFVTARYATSSEMLIFQRFHPEFLATLPSFELNEDRAHEMMQ